MDLYLLYTLDRWFPSRTGTGILIFFVCCDPRIKNFGRVISPLTVRGYASRKESMQKRFFNLAYQEKEEQQQQHQA